MALFRFSFRSLLYFEGHFIIHQKIFNRYMFVLDKNKTYQKETESKVVIRFQDCDPLRHLNNAKYFDYFFNAREDQVPRLYGLQAMDFHSIYNATWVVYNHQISYI